MKRILVVEDNLINQKTFAAILRVYYIVDFANNGRDALCLLDSNEYDLILMDYSMPVMDGAETTLLVRNSENCHKDIPIIMITSNCSLEDREYCLVCGVNEYLLKPILPENLLYIIDYYLIFK